jgi:hypothetical protein
MDDDDESVVAEAIACCTGQRCAAGMTVKDPSLYMLSSNPMFTLGSRPHNCNGET